MSKALSIVVPAYNEEGNIIRLVERIHHALVDKFVYEVIVIDDNSSDATFEETLTLLDKYPVSVHKKQGKQGKTYSLLEGFSLAQHDYIAMIDADLQYPPEALCDMMDGLNHCDVQVAKRRDQNIPFYRKISSQVYSKFFGHMLLGLPYDIQSGLKVFKKEVLSVVNIEPDEWGFDYQFLYHAKNNNFTIGQTDITFAAREFGESKITLSSYVGLFLGIMRFRLNSLQFASFLNPQLTFFMLIGVLNTLLDITITLLLSYFFQVSGGVELVVINSFAFCVALVNSYVLNKIFTFKDSSVSSGSKISKYVLISLLSLTLSNLVVYSITSYVMYQSSLILIGIAKIFATGVSMISNYLGYKYWVFK